MRTRLLKLIGTAAVIVSAVVFFKPAQVTVAQESAMGSVKPPASAPVLKTPWANRTCRESGPTNSTRPYNALPSMRTRNSSPTRSGRNSISNALSCTAAILVRNAGPRSMSAAPITQRS